MIEPYSSQVIRNLQKADGQLGTVLKMAREDRYCMDIIQQCNAVIGILRQTTGLILESHLRTCGAALGSKSAKTRDRFIQEIIRAVDVAKRRS